ncbi:hypothetical protein DT603_15710 [Pseudoxanthomonas gei]|uniref:Uncharacterized protein n=2 Tax=Pseudoxanthomonas gei TaxID=1383030 RepID=A0ABX0ALZ9_9GAMM|nr:hypothetical protein [Pseudoxanthomonas gei]
MMLVQPLLLLAQAATMGAAVTYAGGDGTTLRKSVVIVGAHTAAEGVAAELHWISEHLPGATVESRGQITGPPHYDVLTVKLADGKRVDLHFDITAFHGK